MAIRYDKKLNNEINRVVKNFNQKIARLEKQERELLPARISKKQLKSESYSRTDLKRKLKELERFSTRGAEDVITTSGGVRVTKYELQNMKRENARLKRSLTLQIKHLQTTKVKIFGKEQTTTFSQMGDQHYLNLLARREALDKKFDQLSKEEFERLKKLIKKTGTNKQYMEVQFKENYFKMLTDLAYYNGYPKDKLLELKKKLYALNSSEFLHLFRTDKSIEAILFYYPIVTGSVKGVNKTDVAGDIEVLYDNLIDNIDVIIESAKQ